MRASTIWSHLIVAILISGLPLYAGNVSVDIGESGTEIEAGAFNSSKDGLDAEVGDLWGVSNTSNKDGLLYFSYSDLAGTNLPSTIQEGTYTFSARIGASNVGDGFSGLNDITDGTNTEQGSVAGFFSTLSDDAETAKNNMVSEFNEQTGVTYVQPTEEDPAALSFTTWTFSWIVEDGSPVIGTNPYFGVYTKTGESGGNGFWDDSTLTYSETIAPLPSINDFSSDLYMLQTTGTLVTLSWDVSTNATSLSISPSIGDVLPSTVNGIGQTSVIINAETTFTLTASTEVQSLSSTLTIEAPSPVISDFSADDYYVTTNAPVVLSWAASSADTFTLSDAGSVSATNSMTVYPAETTTYTLIASNDLNSVETNLTVTVGPERPNILIILVDDYGPMDTSVPFLYDSYDDDGAPITTAFNNFYHTPNMETLAEQGMKFTQAYALPVCSPTRCTLMTGYNSPRHGIDVHLYLARTIDNSSFDVPTERGANNWRYQGLETTDVTLPKLLGAEGYRTIHCGKAHYGSDVIGTGDPTGIGFDINLGGSEAGAPGRYICDADDGYSTSSRTLPNLEAYEEEDKWLAVALTEALSDSMEDAVNDGVPFFGYMAYYSVHEDFTTNPNATNDYSAAYNTEHRKFGTMVEGVDTSIGDILAKLAELGIAEDTLIFFLGDNGSDSPVLSDEAYAKGDDYDDYPIRGKKASAYEGGTRVPLIITWASNNVNSTFQQSLAITAGSVEHDMVGAEDIMPSILSAANVTPEDYVMDGYDLGPYLRSESGTHRPQKILRLMGHEHRSDYFLWYRDADYKIIYRFHTEEFELYNITDDPDESEDLASDQPERVVLMARTMAQELDDAWGDYGELWPTHNPTEVKVPDRPLEDDPFWIDYSVDGRDEVDSDGDGITDEEEDADADGLVDEDETDSDSSDTDGDGSDDYTELRLNLDPLDADESFAAQVSEEDDSLCITWPSASNTSYNILTTTNLVDTAWQVAVSNVQASAVSDETSQVIDDADQRSNFIRVELLP